MKENTYHQNIENITLKTADGICVKGEHRHSTLQTPKATVIVVHGFTASIQDESFLALMNILTRPDLDLIAYDSRGHGESEGEATFGNREYLDIEAAVNLALLCNAPILLIGVSAGATSIVNYLYKDSYPDQIKGAGLISSPSNWKGRLGVSSFYLAYLTQTKAGRRRLEERHRVNLKFPIEVPIAPIDAVPRIQVPLLFAGGTDDRLLGTQASYHLYQKANHPKRLELAAGAGHGPSESLGDAVERGFDWLREQI